MQIIIFSYPKMYFANGNTQCPTCDRVFDHWNPKCNENSLRQHLQVVFFNDVHYVNILLKVHQPRNVPCPLCGEERFRSSINAVQHVEAGACSKCRGQDNARRQVFDFISRNEATRQFVRGVPQLEYHGGCEQDIPERPYACQMCPRDFKNMSSLMQHMVSIT